MLIFLFPSPFWGRQVQVGTWSFCWLY